MISTRDLSGLGDIRAFRRLAQSLAMLDAVLSPEWEDRYYSFNAQWAAGEEMASMRDGSGDSWFALLCPAGVALHGLAHESTSFRYNEPDARIFRDLPEEFAENFLREPAFDTKNSTFCIWRRASDTKWSCSPNAEADDGSEDLLSILDGDPQNYIDFAEWYYEVDVALADVSAIYSHIPLTAELVKRLNPGAELSLLTPDIEQIGYPSS